MVLTDDDGEVDDVPELSDSGDDEQWQCVDEEDDDQQVTCLFCDRYKIIPYFFGCLSVFIILCLLDVKYGCSFIACKTVFVFLCSGC